MIFNPDHRTVVIPDQLAAVLCTGPDKVRSGWGNGDCLLLDFQRRVFAVADAAERHPIASRVLLERLARRLVAKGAPSCRADWLALVNSVYARQNYNHKTTLSIVAVAKKKNRTTLFIIHGGDSPIVVANRSQNEIEFISRPDMVFAGRAQALSIVTELELGPDDYTVVIASDGLNDLPRPAQTTLPDFVLSRLVRPALHLLPDTIAQLQRGLAPSANPDDLAVLAFDPKNIRVRRRAPLIIGGTSAAEEAALQNSLHNKKN